MFVQFCIFKLFHDTTGGGRPQVQPSLKGTPSALVEKRGGEGGGGRPPPHVAS